MNSNKNVKSTNNAKKFYGSYTTPQTKNGTSVTITGDVDGSGGIQVNKTIPCC